MIKKSEAEITESESVSKSTFAFQGAPEVRYAVYKASKQ